MKTLEREQSTTRRASIIGLSAKIRIPEGFANHQSAVAAADGLYGYDGQSYWKLSIGSTVTYRKSKDNGELLGPLSTSSHLTVIPKDEAENARAGVEPDRRLSSIDALVAEFRRVAQFGFSCPMQGKPGIPSSNVLVVTGTNQRTQTITLTGSADRPETLTYEPSADIKNRVRVSVDYADDVLIIDQFSATARRNTPASTICYHILSTRTPAQFQNASFFSSQTYTTNLGKVNAD